MQTYQMVITEKWNHFKSNTFIKTIDGKPEQCLKMLKVFKRKLCKKKTFCKQFDKIKTLQISLFSSEI